MNEPGLRVVSDPAPEAAKLRVAVNAMCLWRPVTGIGQYTLNLARVWAAQQRFDARYFYGSDWSPLAAPRVAGGLSAFKRVVKRFVPKPYEVSRALLQRGFDQLPGPADVYFEPNFLPFRLDVPKVITVHDLSYVRYAQTHPSDRVKIMSRLLPVAIEQAAHILTDSYFQRDEITSHFGIAAERITVAQLGVAPEFRPRREPECAEVLQRHGLRYRGYLLAVGTLEPRKNLAMVLDAYARLPASLRQRYPLVVAGFRGWNTQTLAPRLRALARSGDVRPLGFVDEADLPAIYSAASLFLYPSLYEGFGLPALEAMASRIPVIVSDCSSLPEVVGDAGVQVAPQDAPGMTLAIMALLDDPAQWEKRSLSGLERSRRFTWEACAATTAGVLERAARLVR